MSRYQTFVDALKDIKLSDNETQPQTFQAIVSNGGPLPQINVTCDRGSSNDFSSLRYSGKSCARAFIQRVNEFIKARNIAPARVLLFATEIFTDEALHWFRCIQTQVTSWDQVAQRLRDDFSQSDYDYRFLSEIRARTQGEKENITIYLSIMSGMFSQLNKPLSEEEKLEIILHNIRPCYATVLTSSADIKDIESLRVLLKNYESVQSRLSQFHEPPKVSSSTLAPNFAYAHGSSSSDAAKSYPNRTNNPNFNQNYPTNYQNRNSPQQNANLRPNFNNVPKPVHSVEKKAKFCPRCRVDTHGLRTCTAERKILCFRCGRPDVRIYDCPDCQQSNPSQPKN